MNLSEINWDINAAGTWPTPLKLGVIFIVSILVGMGGFYYVTLTQLDELTAMENQEVELKTTFETKQKKSINLADYRSQLDLIEASLGEMLKQMPTKAEVASLLVDISQTGLASGLEFKLFQPSPEVRKDFYSELPIAIEVVGKYEELGLFVSGLASLPRIVTVHDVKLSPVSGKPGAEKKENRVSMSAVIKTYNEGGPEESEQSVKKKRVQ